jgi:hypothetical protein
MPARYRDTAQDLRRLAAAQPRRRLDDGEFPFEGADGRERNSVELACPGEGGDRGEGLLARVEDEDIGPFTGILSVELRFDFSVNSLLTETLHAAPFPPALSRCSATPLL